MLASSLAAVGRQALGLQVAVKQYQKGRLSASKIRAIKREAAMMATMTRKQCVFQLAAPAAALVAPVVGHGG